MLFSGLGQSNRNGLEVGQEGKKHDKLREWTNSGHHQLDSATFKVSRVV